MSVAKITETYLDDIADAIRFKLSTESTYTPPQMASAIMSITGGPNAVAVVDTIDPDTGGTIRRIIGTDISGDTVSPASLLAGYTAHTADGTPIVGVATGGIIQQDENGYLVFSESGGGTSGGWIKSLSAVFDTTGLAVLTTDSLDDLRDRLTVTATYQNDTSEVVTAYKLTGTLTSGTSTINVYYGDNSTTFTVTVYPATDITPAMSANWGTGSATTLVKNATDKSFLVYSTSDGTYKALTYNDLTFDSGYAYRLSADCEYFAGTIRLAFVNSNSTTIEYTEAYTASGHYVADGVLSDSSYYTATGGLRLFITFSTSQAGRAVFRNVKVVKYSTST